MEIHVNQLRLFHSSNLYNNNNNNNKILFVIHSSAQTGGAEDDIENLLCYLSKKNKYIIHGLFPNGPRKNIYIKYFDKWGMMRWGVFPVIYEGIFNYLKYFFKFFIQFYQIWKFVRKEKYDLCVVSVSVLLWPVIFLKLLNYRTVVFIKETIEPELFRKVIYKILSLYGCFFIPNSKIIENEFIKFTGNENIETVYSSVAENEYEDLSDKEYELSIGIDSFSALNRKDNLKLLVIGNFTRIKNNILAAQAIGMLKNEAGINPILFIVGSDIIDKKYFNQFNNYISQNNISSNIYLLGSQSKKILNYLYKKVDLFIIPSLSEGIPLVLVYALKNRVPIITTNVGGISDVIENNLNGILISPDKDSLYIAIKLLYSDNELRDKLVNNGYKTYQERFNLEKNLSLIENIIDSHLHK